MKWAGSTRLYLLGLVTGSMLLAGCGGTVEVPKVDEQTAEQKRQEYEEMIKKERMNQ